jgi:hypothetical protein
MNEEERELNQLSQRFASDNFRGRIDVDGRSSAFGKL